MTPLERRVRALVYRHLIDTTQAPDVDALAAAAGASELEVTEALRALADRHALVLQPQSSRVWMAHPFSAVPTAYPVESGGRTYFANCAWDAAGVLAIVGDGRCVTRCDDCGAELTFAVEAGTLRGRGVVHFLVPAQHFWDDIAFT
jgi:alkylmercury lyase-like protein